MLASHQNLAALQVVLDSGLTVGGLLRVGNAAIARVRLILEVLRVLVALEEHQRHVAIVSD